MAERLPEKSELFSACAAEIAQIDLELRWKYLATEANRQTNQGVQSLLAVIARMPSTKDYLQVLLPQGGNAEGVHRQILETELKARGRFGDAPSPESFGFPRDLWQPFEKYFPKISVWRGSACQADCPVVGPITIGRQSLGEPSAIVVHHHNSNAKLICCPLDENTVSREQVKVIFRLGRWIEVVNSSSNRDFRVTGQASLRPRTTAMVALPCTVDLGSISLRIGRPSSGN